MRVYLCLLFVLLAACADQRVADKCTGYGLAPGSAEHADCQVQTAQVREMRKANAATNYAAMQEVFR